MNRDRKLGGAEQSGTENSQGKSHDASKGDCQPFLILAEEFAKFFEELLFVGG